MDLEKRLEHWIIGRLYVSRLFRNHIDAGNRRNEIQVGSVLVVENSISQMADNAMENENAPTDPLEHSNVHSDRIFARSESWVESHIDWNRLLPDYRNYSIGNSQRPL